MILRRLSEHLRRQNWLAVGLDFLIVVLGVFLGIQLGNWNEYAGDRRAEAEYLRQLQSDLHNIQVEVDAQIEIERFHTRLAGRVYDLIRNDRSADRALKIDIGLSQLAVRRTLRTQSPTFLNLQGSGQFDLISDPELRAAIISYFYSTSRLEAAIDKNNAIFIDEDYIDFILSMGVPPREWDSGLMEVEMPYGADVPSGFRDTVWKSALYAAGGADLSAPPDAELWDELIPRLAWRGKISANNEGLARSLKDATEDLEEKIDRHMDGRAP